MDLLQFKEQLFLAGKEQGFADMELYYERNESFECGLFKGEIDSYETSEVFGVSFRGQMDGKMGFAFTEKLDEESISFLLNEAKENAKYVEGDPEYIFSGSEEYGKDSFYSNALKEVSIPEKIDFLKEIEGHLYAYDERVIATDYFSLSSTEVERKLFNTKGLVLEEKKNYLSLYVSVVIKQGDETKSGTFSKITRDFSRLNAKKIAEQAVEDGLSKLGAKSIKSRAYPIVLHHDAAASLLNTFSPIFSAEKIQKGQSLLKDKHGEMVASLKVSIVDDPYLEEGVLSRTFDSEGVATKKLAIISEGKLEAVLHNQTTAGKEGCPSTGHGYRSSYKSALSVAPTNLFIELGENSYEELIASVVEGILIMELQGLHSGANPISGDFSVAAQGFYIKDGKIETPLNQMTVAGNFYELLQQVEEVGTDLEFGLSFVQPGYIGSPSLKIKELAVTVE